MPWCILVTVQFEYSLSPQSESVFTPWMMKDYVTETLNMLLHIFQTIEM